MKIKVYIKDFRGKEIAYLDAFGFNVLGCIVWAAIGFSLGVLVTKLF